MTTKGNGKFSEVLIIGGGVIGLSLARELYRKGFRQITILDRGQVGKEASYAAAGMLSPHAEADKPDDFYYFCSESGELYPQFAEDLLEKTGIDIQLDREGTLCLALREKDLAEIHHRLQWQKKAGLPVEYLSASETRKLEPFVSPDVLGSLFFPHDWQVENRFLLQALRKFCQLNNINLIEDAQVIRLLVKNGRTVGVKTPVLDFYAEKIVLAAGAWSSLIGTDVVSPIEIKPIRGQMISFHTAKRLFSKVIYSPCGYLVPRADGRILVGATVEDAGFDKSVTETGVSLLCENALEIAPRLMNLQIKEKWAGLRPFAQDGYPVLGSFPHLENFFIATAHYRNGILLAPLTARILADKIGENKDSRYLKIFSPERFLLRKLRSLETTV